ncbi:MAG: transketolase [Candidatus Aminicenantaceae bacterium]
MKSGNYSNYKELARSVRLTILRLIHETKSPHIGSSFSIVEILVALYFKILKVSPEDPFNKERDRFILSKGHACPAFYAVLHERGFLTKDELNGFAINEGLLEQHPSLDLKHGIEITSGSLGHGLSIGAGMALAGKLDKANYKVYALLSDGELNEGSTWEAMMFANQHTLNNLIAMVDCNKIQALGHTKDIIDLNPINKKWENFGWHVKQVNGHNFNQIFKAFNTLHRDKPNVIILQTVKGKGVSFMEDNVLWHYRPPDEEEYARAIKELSK